MLPTKLGSYIRVFSAATVTLAALLFLLITIILLFKFFVNDRHKQTLTRVAAVSQQKEIKNKYIFLAPQIIQGSDYIRIPLARANERESSYKGVSNHIVNYLYLNFKKNSSKWLFEGVEQQIVESENLTIPPVSMMLANNNKVIATYYIIRSSLSNNPHQKQSIALSHADGSSFFTVDQDIDSMLYVKQIDGLKLMAVFNRGHDTFASIYNLKTLEKISEQRLPKLDID